MPMEESRNDQLISTTKHSNPILILNIQNIHVYRNVIKADNFINLSLVIHGYFHLTYHCLK